MISTTPLMRGNGPIDPVIAEMPKRLGARPQKIGAAAAPLRHGVEAAYSTLPWPQQIKNIAVMVLCIGGFGDVVASSRVVNLVASLSHEINIDWVVTNSRLPLDSSIRLLTEEARKRVHVRELHMEPSNHGEVDLAILGPTNTGWEKDYLEKKLQRKVREMTGFLEIASSCHHVALPFLLGQPNLLTHENAALPLLCCRDDTQLAMGLCSGNGVFIDTVRESAQLSRVYCCPSYLDKIEDPSLMRDMKRAMGDSFDYESYSFNFGYAHCLASWGKFIQCVALAETEKHVVIALNMRGEFAKPTFDEFCDSLFSEETLALLNNQGYGAVEIYAEEETKSLYPDSPGRKLRIITRPFFDPVDVMQMQLAAERILGTGDNSAIEAWAARCKLFLYENVSNGPLKKIFLEQQVDYAKSISLTLAKLLALFGGDARETDTLLNKPFREKDIKEVTRLLKDPELGTDTLAFCHSIAKKFSFTPVLEAALKRRAWHIVQPALLQLEYDTIDPTFKKEAKEYLKNPQSDITTLTLPLEPLYLRVHETILPMLPDTDIAP